MVRAATVVALQARSFRQSKFHIRLYSGLVSLFADLNEVFDIVSTGI
jgi:hypothetical protein